MTAASDQLLGFAPTALQDSRKFAVSFARSVYVNAAYS
jgi:hypothetical protein